MVQKRETKAINKLCVREILSLSFVCGAYFFEFRGRNLVCFGIAYNFERMRTAFFTRVSLIPEYRIILFVQFGIFGFGIRNPGLWNPEFRLRNPKSR